MLYHEKKKSITMEKRTEALDTKKKVGKYNKMLKMG